MSLPAVSTALCQTAWSQPRAGSTGGDAFPPWDRSTRGTVLGRLDRHGGWIEMRGLACEQKLMIRALHPRWPYRRSHSRHDLHWLVRVRPRRRWCPPVRTCPPGGRATSRSAKPPTSERLSPCWSAPAEAHATPKRYLSRVNGAGPLASEPSSFNLPGPKMIRVGQ